MIQIPDNIQELKAYKPGKSIAEIVHEFSLTKTAVLWNNENNFGCSPKAKQRIREAANELYLYSDPLSIKLRTQIAKHNGITTDHVVVGNGSEGIMAYIMRAFVRPGDLVVTSENTFIGFQILAKGAGADLIATKRTDDYRYDVDAMIQVINENTKVIYIANPEFCSSNIYISLKIG